MLERRSRAISRRRAGSARYTDPGRRSCPGKPAGPGDAAATGWTRLRRAFRRRARRRGGSERGPSAPGRRLLAGGDAPRLAGRVSAKASPMAHARYLLIDDSFRCDGSPASFGARRGYREYSWFARPFRYRKYRSTGRPELAGHWRQFRQAFCYPGFRASQFGVGSSTNRRARTDKFVNLGKAISQPEFSLMVGLTSQALLWRVSREGRSRGHETRHDTPLSR